MDAQKLIGFAVAEKRHDQMIQIISPDGTFDVSGLQFVVGPREAEDSAGNFCGADR